MSCCGILTKNGTWMISRLLIFLWPWLKLHQHIPLLVHHYCTNNNEDNHHCVILIHFLPLLPLSAVIQCSALLPTEATSVSLQRPVSLPATVASTTNQGNSSNTATASSCTNNNSPNNGQNEYKFDNDDVSSFYLLHFKGVYSTEGRWSEYLGLTRYY